MIRLMRFALISCVVITAVSGCSLFSSKDPQTEPAPLVDIKSSVTIQAAWKASVGKSNGFVFAPAVADKRVYAVGTNGELTAFELSSGKQLWKVDAGKWVSGGVGAGNNIILIGTQKGDFIALDNNGKQLWKVQLGAEVLAPANVDGRTVVVRTADGRLLGLGVDDGRRKWNYQRVTPPLALRSYASATVVRRSVFAGFSGGIVSALELDTGRVGWESVIAAPRGSTELERIADVASAPLVDENRVCAVAYQGRVACLDITSGKMLWSREASSSAGIAVDDKNIYVSEESGAVIALDKNTGASIWKQDKLTNRRLGTPVAYGNVVLVGDGFGYIHALSKSDGSFVGRMATDGSALSATPQLADGLALFQTRDGGLYAVRPQ